MGYKYPKIIIRDDRIACVAVGESTGDVEWATAPPPGMAFRLTRCRQDNEHRALTVITADGAKHWVVSTVRLVG